MGGRLDWIPKQCCHVDGSFSTTMQGNGLILDPLANGHGLMAAGEAIL
jgi:hypothetical protein